MSESTDILHHMILQLHKEKQNMGLIMNIKKTNVMFNNYVLDYKT